MATKKGIVLTAAIIGGFVAASFLVYLSPTTPEPEVEILPSDPGAELAFAMDRNEAVLKEFELTFEMWRNDEIEAIEFTERTDRLVKQADGLVTELKGSGPPEEWVDSYFLYIRALEGYKTYFENTKVNVNHLSSGKVDPKQKDLLLDSMSELLKEAEDLVEQSKAAMP